MNVLFAASSIGLLVTMGAMVYDDYHRGWKGYQQRFQALEAEKTRSQIEEAGKAVDKAALESQQKDLEAARALVQQHSKDLEAAQAKVKGIAVTAYRDDLAYRTIKST